LTRRIASGLPDASYVEVRFEDLISDPRSFLAELCSFLGEELSPSLFELRLARHHIGRWREELPRASRVRVEAMAGETLSRLGYAC